MLLYLLLFGSALIKRSSKKKLSQQSGQSLLDDYSHHGNNNDHDRMEDANDELNDPFLFRTNTTTNTNNANSSKRSGSMSSHRSVSQGNTGEFPPLTRGISISEYINQSVRSVSISLRVPNEPLQGGGNADDMTPVRTMSVA